MESLSHCCAATDALRHCTCCAGEEEEVWEKRKKSTMGALLGFSLYFTLFLFLSPSSPLSFFLSLPLCEALSLCLLFQAFILFLNTYTHSLTLSRTLSLFHVVALPILIIHWTLTFSSCQSHFFNTVSFQWTKPTEHAADIQAFRSATDLGLESVGKRPLDGATHHGLLKALPGTSTSS